MWSLYKQKASQVWWVSFYHNGQRVRRSTGETDRSAANEAAKRIQAEHWTAVPLTDERTWGQAVMAWLDVQPRSDSELLSLAKFGRVYADRALSEVTRDSVHEALATFCRTAGTYMRYRAMITAILNQAKDAGWITAVPKLASRRDAKPKERTWITPEQWERLYAELPPHMQPMALFAMETGLRQANVLGLKWSNVDLDRHMVWVEAGDAKAKRAISVPLSDAALDVLQKRKQAPPYRPDRGKGEPVTSEFVFTFRGKPIKEVKTAFMAACVRAGVGKYVTDDTGTHYQGFTWHGMRHSWATWHKKNSTPDEVLQKLGAWRDPRMVQNYAHFDPGFVAQFVNNARKK